MSEKQVRSPSPRGRGQGSGGDAGRTTSKSETSHLETTPPSLTLPAVGREQLAANKLFIGSGEFLRACAAPDQFPPGKLPEIAFIGRSNVGKSSLINGLTARRALARSSKTPGRTQQIIFFDIRQTLTLADLPGYGHAKAPRDEQALWNELIHHYLRSRPQLFCVFLLIDGRHGALANDLSMMQFLDRAGISYQVVLTKIDKVKMTEQDARLQQIEAQLAQHPAARAKALMVSAEKNIGIEDLRLLITTLAKQFGK